MRTSPRLLSVLGGFLQLEIISCDLLHGLPYFEAFAGVFIKQTRDGAAAEPMPWPVSLTHLPEVPQHHIPKGRKIWWVRRPRAHRQTLARGQILSWLELERKCSLPKVVQFGGRVRKMLRHFEIRPLCEQVRSGHYSSVLGPSHC